MSFLRLDSGARFTNKQILLFLLPVIFEQLTVAVLGIADTSMVSSLGETALSGVALVSRIDNFAKQFFVALAQGGSVVMTQYIGAQNKKSAQTALKDNIRIVVGVGLLLALVMCIFKDNIISLLFGGADKAVLDASHSYFTITALSYPLVALYYAGTASFRAMGQSKIPFISMSLMMTIKLILTYLFIFVFDLGVMGAALSTLLAMGIMGIIQLCMLMRQSNKVQLQGLFHFDFNKSIGKKILTISVPNGIESAMFQLGALLIAGLVSGLGTAAISADHVARSVTPFVHCTGSAFAAVFLMVSGHCMGADSPKEVRFYTKHLLKLDYIITLTVSIVFMVFMNPIISIFDISAEAREYSKQILLLYTVCSCLFYPTSFAIAASLRGTGDTKYVMMVSTLSMFLFRIGAAYIFVHLFNLGILGTWIAMVSDWVIRSIVFIIRFTRGKWQENHVI